MNGLSLTLLEAGLLGGLATIIIPTIVHLLSRRRARRVRFGPMELLLRSQKRTARSIRLRQLLLLSVRTLLVAAVAAALLRPLIEEAQTAQKTDAPIAVVVVVDASASMQAVLDGRPAFDSAIREARDVVTEVPEDVRIALVACGAEARDVVAPTFDRGAVLAALDALRVESAYADVATCLARGATLALAVEGATKGGDDDAGPSERRIVLISDFAAHGFQSGSGGLTGLDARGLRVELRNAVDEAPPPNHGFRDVVAVPTSQGLSVRILAARYLGPETDVVADLFVGGKRGPRAVLPMSSGAILERIFTVGNELMAKVANTANTGKDVDSAAIDGGTLMLSLSDDALPLDNVVVLPTEARPAVSVLVVDGEPDAIPFSDEVYYLTQALQASRVGDAGQSRLQVTVAPPEKVDAASLVGVDVVVLANVARLSAAAAAAVVSHAEAGHGVFLSAGDQVDVEAWNQQLGAILPAVLRGTKKQALLDDANVDDVLGFSRFKTEHPILRAFAGTSNDALPGLSRVRTTASMLVEPDANAPREILARFTNDAPALLERAVGPGRRGRVLMLTTTIDREWTDLPIRPGFLPLMEQVILYLAGALDDERPRTLRVGQPRIIRLPVDATAAVVVLPDGKERILERRGDGASVDAAPGPAGNDGNDDVDAGPDATRANEVRFVDTDQVGLHRILVRNAAGDRRALPGERFTVMMDPREADLTRVDDDVIKATLPQGASIQRDRDDDHGTALWPWLLLAAIAFLGVEAALIARRNSTN